MSNLNKPQEKNKENIGGTGKQHMPAGQGQKPVHAPKHGEQTKTGFGQDKSRDRDDSGQAR